MSQTKPAAKRLGELLRKRRLTLGLWQEDVAKRAGFTASYLSRIENGVYDALSAERLINLADVLALDVERVIAAAKRARVEDLDVALAEYRARRLAS